MLTSYRVVLLAVAIFTVCGGLNGAMAAPPWSARKGMHRPGSVWSTRLPPDKAPVGTTTSALAASSRQSKRRPRRVARERLQIPSPGLGTRYGPDIVQRTG